MAAVSALTSSGYLSVSDYAPGYSRICDITSISDNLKSYVTTVYANQNGNSEYFLQDGKFGKEFLRYAEYTTYGADAGLFIAYRDSDLGHGLVCFGLEFKEDAADRNTNTLWNGKDARLMLYDVNYACRDCSRYVYVNLTDGSWYWNGQSVFEHYNPETCFFKMKHMFDDNIVRYGQYGFTSVAAFFDAIRNP